MVSPNLVFFEIAKEPSSQPSSDWVRAEDETRTMKTRPPCGDRVNEPTVGISTN